MRLIVSAWQNRPLDLLETGAASLRQTGTGHIQRRLRVIPEKNSESPQCDSRSHAACSRPLVAPQHHTLDRLRQSAVYACGLLVSGLL